MSGPGLAGFHSRADFPDAETEPGLLFYRFDGDVVFFNVEQFCDGLLEAVRAAADPVEWVIVDASPISIIDVTALDRIRQLRLELAQDGITLGFAGCDTRSGVSSTAAGSRTASAGRCTPFA